MVSPQSHWVEVENIEILGIQEEAIVDIRDETLHTEELQKTMRSRRLLRMFLNEESPTLDDVLSKDTKLFPTSTKKV